jgi:sterol desaturase/sphingolipid hydroxylase (fatty acid hydroxylase superfamily)
MAWLISFLAAMALWTIQNLWLPPVAWVLERLTARYPMNSVRQLRGVSFMLVEIPISVVIGVALSVLIGGFGLSPLFDLADVAPLAAHPTLMAWVAMGLSVVLLDFFYYWAHRAQHAIPFLWRFHAMHHSIEDLSALNNYAHWSEKAVQFLFKIVPVALLIRLEPGFPGVIAGVLIALHQSYIHSASKVNLGAWSWLINDNVRHRIHHSLEPHHFNKNFAIDFGFWDHLFGTAYVPTPGEWPATGLADQRDPMDFVEYFGWSFMKPGEAANAEAAEP